MAWDGSTVFRLFMSEAMSGAHDIDGTGDTINVSLYNNSVAATATLADYSTGEAKYNGSSTLASTNAVAETSGDANWPAAGIPLLTPSINVTTTQVVEFDAPDLANLSNGAGVATIADAYGCLVYDDTDANDRAICALYFGGSPQAVTAGTFTIVFNASGIFRIAV